MDQIFERQNLHTILVLFSEAHTLACVSPSLHGYFSLMPDSELLEGTLHSPAWAYADKNRNRKFLGHFSLGASRLFWILNYSHRQTWQVCVSCRSWGKPCTLVHGNDGADVAKPLCSWPSDGEGQQLIWTENMDFRTLVAACCCSWGGSSVQALELCINCSGLAWVHSRRWEQRPHSLPRDFYHFIRSYLFSSICSTFHARWKQ